eukprot:CAMPEP_0175154896 /NCGR_PEP_ID=MMETSP0087-20121206/20647_1 /TAXON_ID=136419 /ORGANISM="Unknown Unknown, Strain D1" /LENGTH=84 /DNA_ID=CAMNT_0016441937 /DNA_START=146 /DNA_END=400 /DNA_ORIENTATION=+
MRDFADNFGEARLNIQDAVESINTTYYNEDAAYAKESVEALLQEYTQVQGLMSEEDAKKMRDSWYMKMEQLKAELERMESIANA